VNALYSVYRKNPEGFAEKYLDLLRAGGTKKYDALLKPFGLNASDPRFWRRGLSVIGEFVSALEEKP
jgi:oligoendopeptidase F